MNNQSLLKEQLQAKLKNIQRQIDGSPVTNLQLDKSLVAEIAEITTQLENCNPNPHPLLYATDLLAGYWQLQYSTAREIRALASLPLGLKVGKFYQVIDINNRQFFNLAFVKHFLGLLSGHVKVTASFEPAIENISPAPHRRINVYFDKRYLAIEKILGINTPQLNPFKVVPANNPQGRTATLDITYLDETLRIGRGGDESLFILTKSADIPEL